ncbi:hypothetical protein Ahy_B06g081650 [Arachis hypogaea]|uniref:FAR1 domain-containing protein n=1 Tax=Arachis hypogaea TaxID=3818 RepID=A0A444YLP6_ARAHY|nr:hypothetical protein Ahy_B06g081650 [Arachis hypogaea]
MQVYHVLGLVSTAKVWISEYSVMLFRKDYVLRLRVFVVEFIELKNSLKILMAETGYDMLDKEVGDYGDVLQLSKEEIMSKAFRSDEAAYEFYRRFGKCFGFGIRKGDSGKDESGRVIHRKSFCNRAGLRQRHHYDRLDRQRGHRPKTHTNYEAKLPVYFDVVSGIWRAHGVPTFKILEYMAGQASGYSLMGFTKKDAYNYINKAKHAKLIDGDSNAAVVYFEGIRCRWLDMEIDEFEAEWDDAIEEYGLQNSFWAKETFQKRMMWANAYLQDKFCAGFQTTSRCEGINASLYGMPVMTTCLDPLEKYTANVYTREIFVDAKKEIVSVSAVNFVAKIRCSTTMVYTLEEYDDPSTEMMVLYDRHEHLTQIPERLVLKRWRKDVKLLDKYAEIMKVGSERGFLLRHGALHAAAQWILYVRFDKGKKGDPKPNKLAMYVYLEELGLKMKPAAIVCSETMECDRNVKSNTDKLLTQLMTQIIDISARLGSRLPA